MWVGRCTWAELWPINKSLHLLPPSDSWRSHECDSSHLGKNVKVVFWGGWRFLSQQLSEGGCYSFFFFKLINSSFRPSVPQNVNFCIKTCVSFSTQVESLNSSLLPAPLHPTHLDLVFKGFILDKWHTLVWTGDSYCKTSFSFSNSQLSLISSFLCQYCTLIYRWITNKRLTAKISSVTVLLLII